MSALRFYRLTDHRRSIGGERDAIERGLHAVGYGWREHIGPLRDSLRRDADSCGGTRLVTPQKADGVGLEHASLKHASSGLCKDALVTLSTLPAMSRKYDHATFAGRLGDALEKSGRSRIELAAVLRSSKGEMGVSQAAVGQALGGDTKALTAENCARAARFLGVDGYWLATGEGEMVAKLTGEEELALQHLRDVRRLNKQTYEQIVGELAALSVSMIEAHKTLNTIHGVTSYTTPERAAQTLKPAPRERRQPDKLLGGNSGFSELDEAKERKGKR